MSEQGGGAWKALESLSALREQTALREVVLARQRLAQCEANEGRIHDLRMDYSSRIRGKAGGIISPSEFRLTSHFLSQLETMLDALQAEKAAIVAALNDAMRNAEQAGHERRKYDELRNLDEAKRQARAASAAQRRADAEAIMHHNFKSLDI